MEWRLLPCRRIGLIGGILVGLCLAVSQTARPQGTPRNERGLIFSLPANGEWNQLAIYVSRPGAIPFRTLPPETVKVAHGRMEKFMPADQNASAYFPYNELVEYEAQEVAAGRPPIFVTATYRGKKRPVYFLPVQPPGTRPEAPLNLITRAVNVRDERFIRFWIDRYARPILQNMSANSWIGLDDCRFMISMYGVLDDNGKFVAGVPWDKPFPQNDDEFLEGLKRFFKRLRELAPEIKVMPNIAVLNDWRRFLEIYEDVPGIMTENLLTVLEIPRDYMRVKAYRMLTWYQWLAARNRVVLLRATMETPNTDRIRTALVTYLLVRGNQFYLALQQKSPSLSIEISPTEYMPAKTALGDPVGEMQSQKEPDTPNDGFRLYQRACANGIVYLNLTGRQKVISLSADRTYYNRAGQQVTQLTLDDLTGDYVLTTRP